ncbi:hypothetical protein DOTSEDRAFT_34640 [Dothistroma septosporum NZE10]|uniref:F-box domain-containing protein n=1 Tax=Dothistroma septosporum (strain NZE10 / CBS 128990) TaxID=675120 RepID=N1PMH6_DOTSN|nr:hypothetical protein DOTSEDRAFT_34640 [Dothistroma septosporum NZE10]
MALTCPVSKTMGAPGWLELVISHSDVSALLLSQRVSKVWRRAFDASMLLQSRARLVPTNSHAKALPQQDQLEPTAVQHELKSDDAGDAICWTCEGIVLGRRIEVMQHKPSTGKSFIATLGPDLFTRLAAGSERSCLVRRATSTLKQR